MTVPRFAYSALSAAGDLVTGELDDADADAVIARLHDQALIPIHAAEARATGAGFWRSSWRMPVGELALFSQQLARLLSAGVPLDRALQILIALAGTPRAARAVRQALDAVRDGSSLAEALEAQGAFPGSYVSMVRAGEASGALHAVLARIAEFLTRSAAIRQRIVSAMIYPAVLLVVATGSVALVLTVVLPQFEPLFRDAGAKLPMSTQLVMAAGHVLKAYWWAMLAGAALSAIAVRRAMRLPGVAARWDRAVLRLPVAGGLATRFEVGRFCRTLGVLLASGVPAPRALTLCGATIANRAIAQAVETVAARFKEGQGLSEPLADTRRFPELPIQLIRIGEETGRLEEMLGEVADIYDREVQRIIDRLLALLVPAITIVMGAVIAFIVASVMTAMISVNDLAT